MIENLKIQTNIKIKKLNIEKKIIIKDWLNKRYEERNKIKNFIPYN